MAPKRDPLKAPVPVAPIKSDVVTTLDDIAAMNPNRDPALADPEPAVATTTTDVAYTPGMEALPPVVHAVLTQKLLGNPQTAASTTQVPVPIELPRTRPATPSATTTGPTSSSKGAGVAAAPTLKPSAKNDEYNAKKRRFILRLKINKYMQFYPDQVRDFVPSNWNNLGDAQLEEIVEQCDFATSVGSEGEFIAAAVVGTARAFENMHPFLPAPYCYSQGCSDRIHDQLKDEKGESRVDSMLGSAVNKLGIMYTGTLPSGNPWMMLAFALGSSLHNHCAENQQRLLQHTRSGANEPVEALADIGTDQYADL